MELDRSKAPEFKVPEDFELSPPQKLTLENGANLFFTYTPNLEVVKIEVIGLGKKASLPLSQHLIPEFALALLQEGISTLNGEELAEYFDFHASEISPIQTFSHEGLSLLTTKAHLNPVLEVFLKLFTEATYPQEALEKRKSQKKLGIKLQKEKSSIRATQLFRQSLFGLDHPYGTIPLEEHVDEVTQDRLFFYYREMLWQEMEIFVSGKLSESELQQLTFKLGKLPNRKATNQTLLPDSKTQLLWEESRENAVQSSIRMGCLSIPKTHPDYIGLSVFNTILGGYFGSRLIKNIREDKGHTYGIFSSLGEIGDINYWVVAADVQKAFYQEVIDEIYLEIDRLIEEPTSDDEIEVVRNYMIGQMLSRFSSSFDLMDRFRSVHQSGLDFNFYFDKLGYLKTFTTEDIQAIGRKYFKEKDFVRIVVG
ncbi:M16 family metallopeptidase [Algoriphagus machipongonensis]|uniref:Zinc protease n=1 Tax=Algoriphagus machipongonensis TaxID=388413 RepID=A3I373_9BACT|nr:pitrilysin family protein [Algoriphagus machipongonensis]EAZ79099.1 putative zinc protease [Algoriphagus machipongonensis]